MTSRWIASHLLSSPALSSSLSLSVSLQGADGYQKLEERWLSQEATTIDDQEAEAEDLLNHMLSDQKRADAEKTGNRQRSVKALPHASSADGSERSESGVGHGSVMSVVQELSQERSEFDEAEDAPQHPPPQEAQLEHIGEEQSEADEEADIEA
jgi:hypothetical protein